MPGYRLTWSEYALQKKVETVRDLIICLDAQDLIHGSEVVKYYTQWDGIGYAVHRYLSTGMLPLEEIPEDRLFPDKE